MWAGVEGFPLHPPFLVDSYPESCYSVQTNVRNPCAAVTARGVEDLHPLLGERRRARLAAARAAASGGDV
jgi:hypothetical protein